MADLLIEVGCEELPSSACRAIAEQAPELFGAVVGALGMEGWTLEVAVAPRRFALIAGGLPERIVPPARSVRGPAEHAAFDAGGAPTRAGEGFARGQGVAVEDLVVREGDGGRRFVFAERREAGRPLEEAVPEIAARLVDGLRFGKSMRWGEGTGLRFSRPVRWIVAKVGARTVPFALHGLVAGERTEGHRFLGGPAVVGHAGGYHEALEAAAVIAGHERRRALIVAGLDAAAAEAGGNWRDPGGKLEEVVFLVEWPSVVSGRIDPGHLELPARVLVTAMQSHQRYFPLETAAGELLPAFLAVSNGDPAHAATIVRGNEDVLDARLQDAAFSFGRDREAGLAALEGRLADIVFHARLGTLAAKRDRLVEGVGDLAAALDLDGETREVAREAAGLSKVDQGAVLVAEFSELEGYVAAEYARREGRPEPVARAVEEQYLPAGPDTPLPATAAGAVLAAVDRMDNLVAAFAVDEAPTGSRDPYGLRRAATGLVRIALARGWGFDPCPLMAAVHARLRAQGADLVHDEDDTVGAAFAFILDRFAHLLGAEGVGAEAVAAAAGAGLGGAPATATWARAIQEEREGPVFGAVWTAATRLARIAGKGPEQRTFFASAGDPGEDALRAALEDAQPGIGAAREARDFRAALAAAAPLAAAVDRFFTDVLVNAEDPEVRARRYALVRDAADALGGVADFTRIHDPGGAR